MSNSCSFNKNKDGGFKTICKGGLQIMDDKRNLKNVRSLTAGNGNFRKNVKVKGDAEICGDLVVGGKILNGAIIRQEDLPMVIDKPGKYALADDLVFTPSAFGDVAITIDADRVTLDLCKYKLSQVNKNVVGVTGIVIKKDHDQVMVMNGTVCGFTLGMEVEGGNNRTTLRDLELVENGANTVRAFITDDNFTSFREGGLWVGGSEEWQDASTAGGACYWTNTYDASPFDYYKGNIIVWSFASIDPVTNFLAYNVKCERNSPNGASLGNMDKPKFDCCSFSENYLINRSNALSNINNPIEKLPPIDVNGALQAGTVTNNVTVATITEITQAGSEITVTTSAPHGFHRGEFVMISGTTNFNEPTPVEIDSVNGTGDEFTYEITAAAGGSDEFSGTAQVTTTKLVLPLTPTDGCADQIGWDEPDPIQGSGNEGAWIVMKTGASAGEFQQISYWSGSPNYEVFLHEPFTSVAPGDIFEIWEDRPDTPLDIRYTNYQWGLMATSTRILNEGDYGVREPLFTNCKFNRNFSKNDKYPTICAAMELTGFKARIENCEFNENVCEMAYTGFANVTQQFGQCRTLLRGFYETTFANCKFNDNIAKGVGARVQGPGGFPTESEPAQEWFDLVGDNGSKGFYLIDCEIKRNRNIGESVDSSAGGGMRAIRFQGGDTFTVKNCVIEDNVTTTGNVVSNNNRTRCWALNNFGGNVIVSGCSFKNNGPDENLASNFCNNYQFYSFIYGGYYGTPFKKNVVINDTLMDARDNGFGASNYAVLSGSLGQSGTKIQNCVISSDYMGVFNYGESGTCIVNNTIEDAVFGNFLFATGSSAVMQNKFVNNIAYAVYDVPPVSTNVVTQNTSIGDSGAGFFGINPAGPYPVSYGSIVTGYPTGNVGDNMVISTAVAP